MVPPDPDPDPALSRRSATARPWYAKWRWRALLGVLALGFLSLGAVWISRDTIAGNLIDGVLAENGVEARYQIASITPQRQVIEDLVIGDPALPDFTAERVIVDIAYTFGAPEVSRILVVSPRLYGTLRSGSLSFGALDPLVFAESDDDAALPAYTVAVIDGRARLDSEYGVIGARLEGEGRLDDGFTGELAVTAPGIGLDGCTAGEAILFGALRMEDGAPQFEGPLRLRAAQCAGVEMASLDAQVTASLEPDFSALRAAANLEMERARYGDARAEAGGGDVDFAWQFDAETPDAVAITHDLTLTNVSAFSAQLGTFTLEGDARSSAGFGTVRWPVAFEAADIDLRQAVGSGLQAAESGAGGTLAEPLLARLRRGLDRSATGGTLSGSAILTADEAALRAVVPEARLNSGAGETLALLSRLNWVQENGGLVRASGDLRTGGADLPQITARIDQRPGGSIEARLALAPYSAGGARLAIPRLTLARSVAGDIAFTGLIEADGPIEGGSLRGLAMPLEGRWSSARGLALGHECTNIRFESLALYELSLTGDTVRLCPQAGQALISYRDTLEVTALIEALELSGTLAQTPATLALSRAQLRFPGEFSIDDLAAQVGPPGNSVSLSARAVTGALGDAVAGRFDGAAAALEAVPLDLADLSGEWSYSGSVLRIAQGTFELTDRVTAQPGEAATPRFAPLRAQEAVLTLADNRIEADARLVHPRSGAPVTTVAITHDLATASGGANIAVPGLTFTRDFQPSDVSTLFDGVISLAEGTITGEGRVRWTPDDITSSGTFATDDFDFAAAFGPVSRVRGQIVFTDLVNLTTAPSQILEIGSINPGIEVLAGRVIYRLVGGEVISVEDARWPFMGGTLILRPVDIRYGTSGGQNYIFEMVELDAAQFVAQMELTNIGATGVFDGTVPIYFDAEGNGFMQGGLLISRPPGGNVSYVGELTYEDLGAIGNFAFQSLRSLDYRQMAVTLNGSLAGEIISSFQIDGVRQGEGSSRNFVTRELAKLPIRFNINVRSQNFYQLATMVRSFFDSSYLPNPVDQGLIRAEDGRFEPVAPRSPPAQESAQPPETRRDDEAGVQPPESDDAP